MPAILAYFNAYEIERATSDVTLHAFQPQPLPDFLSLKSFRDEMMAALSAYGVEVGRIATDEFWQPFVQCYMGVIRNCPLEAWEQNASWSLKVMIVSTRCRGWAWVQEVRRKVRRIQLESGCAAPFIRLSGPELTRYIELGIALCSLIGYD